MQTESQTVFLRPQETDLVRFYSQDRESVLSITKDGRIFWRQREVETDDELRAAMKEVAKSMTKG